MLNDGVDDVLWDHGGKVAPIDAMKQRRESIPTSNPQFSAAFIYRQRGRHMQSFVSPFRPVDNEMNRPNPQLVRMKKWMRKSTINFLERNKDVIAAPGFVPLCNKMIVDVMATGFEVVAREIVAGRNWRNLRVLGLVLFLAAANMVFHVEAATQGRAAHGTRMAIAGPFSAS